MEWLVRMHIKIPPDMGADQKTRLYALEAVYAHQLAANGMLRRLWRVPCGTDNVGLWEAQDATVLHDAIVKFPLFRYMTIDVTPLAFNHNDPGLTSPERNTP